MISIGLGLLSGEASATLIAVDLFSPGDGFVTRDTATGFEWLDLPLTTDLSVNAVLAGAGGWLPAGWRYAPRDELLALWSSAGVIQTGPIPDPVNIPGISELAGLLGLTTLDAVIGVSAANQLGQGFDCPTGSGEPCYFGSFLTSDGAASLDDTWYGGDASYPFLGHWLTRTYIPEPATAVLLGIGFLGLGAFRRRLRVRVRC